MAADANLAYLEPTAAPTSDPSLPIIGQTDAEVTGRSVAGVPVLRQRVSAPGSDALLTSVLAALQGTLGVVDATAEAKLEAIRVLLAATVTVGGTVAVSNLPAMQPVSGTVGINNFPATQVVSDTRLPATLDNGSVNVADVFMHGETFAAQPGAGAVLTFGPFASQEDLIWVLSQGAVSFCDPFGGAPANGTGIYCDNGVPNPITVRVAAAGTIKVWAPGGATVYCWAYGG